MITCEPILCKSLVALMPASGHNLAISGPDDFLMEPFFSIHLNPVVAGCGKYDFKTDFHSPCIERYRDYDLDVGIQETSSGISQPSLAGPRLSQCKNVLNLVQLG